MFIHSISLCTHRLIGPNANPKTVRLSPNVATSLLTCMSSANFVLAGENPDACQLTDKSIRMIGSMRRYFRHLGQLRGFEGSSGEKLTVSAARNLVECAWGVLSLLFSREEVSWAV